MYPPNAFSRSLLAGIALLAALTAACSRTSDRRFELRGQILSVSADRMEASVKHEEIPNFMAAMTMPYKVRDAKEYEGLKPGDLFVATLVVETNGAYLTGVRRVGEAPIEPAPTAAPSASSGFELLKPGEALPATTFADQDGRTRTFESFKGSTVVLTFIYTSCPIPTFCPLMDRHFVTLQETIKADPALKQVHLVTVSFDPTTDTPAVLKKHAGVLGADLARWTFLTGDRDNVDQFAMRFGVSISRGLTDPLDITHNLRTAIVDPSGLLLKTYTGNSWTPADIVADLRKSAGAS
jgi:protein SCO1/2